MTLTPKTTGRTVQLFALALLFGIAHSQHPLFSSNQNTYFLHGLADAGVGVLSEDPIAQSADPTPVFSALVSSCERWAPRAIYYLFYLALFGLFFVSTYGIARVLMAKATSESSAWILSTLIVVVHSYVLHKFLWPFQSGVAEQYVLGKVFQPSVFGVFLLASVWMFLRRHILWASAALAVAALFHPTYLIAAGCLVLAYWWIGSRDAAWRGGLWAGTFLCAAILGPFVWYLWSVFQPTSPLLSQQAAALLVHERIPHHAVPSEWFDFGTVKRLAIIAAGLWLVRGHRLAKIVWALAGVGGLLITVQVVAGSDRLALLFPWRVSVVLVPLCTVVILARITEAADHWLRSRVTEKSIRLACLAVLIGLGIIGAGRFVYLSALHVEPKAGLYAQVSRSRESGDLYLIPVGWQDFRLATGTPVYVDHKTHPYNDAEVLDWWSRLSAARRYYDSGDGLRAFPQSLPRVDFADRHLRHAARRRPRDRPRQADGRPVQGQSRAHRFGRSGPMARSPSVESAGAGRSRLSSI